MRIGENSIEEWRKPISLNAILRLNLDNFDLTSLSYDFQGSGGNLMGFSVCFLCDSGPQVCLRYVSTTRVQYDIMFQSNFKKSMTLYR